MSNDLSNNLVVGDTTQPHCPSTPSAPVDQLFRLDGKRAFVTGGTRGIGHACAVALAQAGAQVCLAVRPGTDAASLLAKVPTNPAGPHVSVVADLADLSAVRLLLPQAVDALGGLDIFVNVAGIQRRAPATEFTESDWDDVLNVNLKSAWLLSQQAGRYFLERKQGGKIIHFASLLTFQGGMTVPAYAASKGAIGQLVKALSNEWAKHGVQVNAIAPGYIATDMNEGLLSNPERLRQISGRIPANRWGTAEDFAGPVVFLASAASRNGRTPGKRNRRDQVQIAHREHKQLEKQATLHARAQAAS